MTIGFLYTNKQWLFFLKNINITCAFSRNNFEMLNQRCQHQILSFLLCCIMEETQSAVYEVLINAFLLQYAINIFLQD